MAKLLVFQFGEAELAFSLNKVERSKLYGYKEMEALDDRGRRCELATLASDGRTVVARGGSGLGYLTTDGQWREKSALQAVDLEGKPIQPVASSFSAPIKLFDTVGVDEYLRHNVRLVYELQTENDASELNAELRRGTIFAFPYSYRGGLEYDAGFLLTGEDGGIFMTVGNPTAVEFVELRQAIAVEEEEESDETDLMDFDMI